MFWRLQTCTDRLLVCRQPVPCPIVLEQCAGNRAALITVVIEGPTGGHQFAPAGVSGQYGLWVHTGGRPAKPARESDRGGAGQFCETSLQRGPGISVSELRCWRVIGFPLH